MIIPIILVVFSLVYIGYFYSQTGEFIHKDIGLSGGTSLTLNDVANIDVTELESSLNEKYGDIIIRKLSDLRTGSLLAIVIETSAEPEQLKSDVEEILGYQLSSDNSSTEFSGSSLGAGFYKQLLVALIIAFALMSLVIFILFRTFIPSVAVIFAAFSDIVIPLAILNFFEVRISAAGIAAFLMLIGYSVDTDILLTTRAIKNREGTLNSRLYRAFKTGTLMSITALCAVLPAFFLITGLPDSFRQIFLILGLGLFADIINTWMTNIGIIKWYCIKKGIN